MPQQEQDAFLIAYRRTVTAAENPEGFSGLLRLWAKRAVVVAAPGYAEARAAARASLASGMPLDTESSGG